MKSAAIRPQTSRLWEVDALRGVAIIEMVIFHFTWDINFFGIVQLNLFNGPWQWFARNIATLFIFTMGLSLTLSYSRERQKTGQVNLFGKYLGRGAKILGWGLVITVATYFFIGQGFVVFGILHLIGLSVILTYPFLNGNRWVTLAAGIGIILAGIYVDGLQSQSPWLIWLGIKQTGRAMVDYYPVLPYFGISLLGVFVGRTFYPAGRRTFHLPDFSRLPLARGLQFLGRHSLLIYLLHQPILIGILMGLQFLARF